MCARVCKHVDAVGHMGLPLLSRARGFANT
jgi:hypothetical protein